MEDLAYVRVADITATVRFIFAIICHWSRQSLGLVNSITFPAVVSLFSVIFVFILFTFPIIITTITSSASDLPHVYQVSDHDD